MKYYLSIILALLLCSTAWGEVSYQKEKEYADTTRRVLTMVGTRDGVVVHRIMFIDRDKKGTYREYIERFYIDGSEVLRILVLSDGAMIECKKLGDGMVSYDQQAGSPSPNTILIGKSYDTAEVYELQKEGYHLAYSDEDREAFILNYPKKGADFMKVTEPKLEQDGDLND